MKDARNELRTAIFTRLDTDLAYQVYSVIPRDPIYPHIAISSLNAIRQPTGLSVKNLPGQQITATIDIWDYFTESKERTNNIANDIMESITDADTQTGMNALTLINFDVVNQLCGNSRDVPNPDQSIQHAQVDIDFWIYEK